MNKAAGETLGRFDVHVWRLSLRNASFFDSGSS